MSWDSRSARLIRLNAWASSISSRGPDGATVAPAAPPSAIRSAAAATARIGPTRVRQVRKIASAATRTRVAKPTRAWRLSASRSASAASTGIATTIAQPARGTGL